MEQAWRYTGKGLFWLVWPGSRLLLPLTIRTRVLLVHKDQVLVTRDWLGVGQWGLPGGGLHSGETPVDGALRELHEETDLTLAAGDLRPHGLQTFRQHGLSFGYHLFIGTPRHRPAVRRGRRWEVAEVRWVTRRELTSATAANDVLRALQVWSEAA